jgi:hypothetical protein
VAADREVRPEGRRGPPADRQVRAGPPGRAQLVPGPHDGRAEAARRHPGRVGPAAKIRGTLDLIRDVANDAQQAETSFLAAPWIARADDIALGVRLAEQQDRPKQKETLADLKTRTDALLAELLETVARLHAPDSTAG